MTGARERHLRPGREKAPEALKASGTSAPDMSVEGIEGVSYLFCIKNTELASYTLILPYRCAAIEPAALS